MTKTVNSEILNWAGPQLDYGAATWVDEDGNEQVGFRTVSIQEASNKVNRIADSLGVRFDEATGEWVLV